MISTIRARLLAALLLALVPAAAWGQPKPPPGGQAWPCIQPKTPNLSLGAVWSGPDLGPPDAWTRDLDAAELAQKLASRRTPLDQVDGLLDSFAATAGADAKTRLPLVFAGVFEVIDAERAKIIAGIERYAAGQQKLADRLRDEGEKLTAAKDSPAAAETPQSKELQEHLAWDTRIFEERARSLTYVCEVPVLLEQRVFEIGRRIQARL